MKQVIIDTDLGVDDAHAVILALKSAELQVRGITTVFGNAKVNFCTENVLYVLELIGRTEIPVRQGSPKPLLGEINLGMESLKFQLEDARRKIGKDGKTHKLIYTSPHGEKGLGNFELPGLHAKPKDGNAIVWMVNTVLESPKQIEILALGPLTNLALASLIEPTWAENVKRVIFMGGALTVPGNVGPLSTANIANDAEAAKIVFHAGFPEIVMVGQDVTRAARLTPKHKEIMKKANTKVTSFLGQITEYYAKFYVEREPELEELGHPIHDMLASAYLIDESIFRTEKMYVTVETQGVVTRGQTVADMRKFSPYVKQMDVCVEVDKDKLFQLYLERIVG